MTTVETRTLLCEACDCTFETDISEDEAMKEKEEIFGDTPREECMVICDDCFKELVTPDRVADWKERI